MYTNYAVTETIPAGTAAMGIIIYLAVMALAILCLIAWGKLFKKAGLPWERIFVPMYGTYWCYKLAKSTFVFWTILIGSFVVGLLSGILMVSSPEAGAAVLMLFALAMLVMMIIYFVRLAKAYGKSGLFALGLILLYPLFLIILGFGKSEYVGNAAPKTEETDNWQM